MLAMPAIPCYSWLIVDNPDAIESLPTLPAADIVGLEDGRLSPRDLYILTASAAGSPADAIVQSWGRGSTNIRKG